MGPYSYLCVRKLFAYLRKFGIIVSMRTQTILRTLVLVFLGRAYANRYYRLFAYAKWHSQALLAYAEEISRRERR